MLRATSSSFPLRTLCPQRSQSTLSSLRDVFRGILSPTPEAEPEPKAASPSPESHSTQTVSITATPPLTPSPPDSSHPDNAIQESSPPQSSPPQQKQRITHTITLAHAQSNNNTTHRELYTITRTPSHHLPVYQYHKAGGNLQLTRVRKITGDAQALCAQLEAGLAPPPKYVRVNGTTGHVVVRGWYKRQIDAFLVGKGF